MAIIGTKNAQPRPITGFRQPTAEGEERRRMVSTAPTGTVWIVDSLIDVRLLRQAGYDVKRKVLVLKNKNGTYDVWLDAPGSYVHMSRGLTTSNDQRIGHAEVIIRRRPGER